MKLSVECDNCKEVFSIGSDDLSQFNVTHQGMKYLLTSYKCPKCEKVYIVQADNKESVIMLEKNKVMFRRQMKLHHQRRPVSAYEKKKFKDARHDLDSYRVSMMKMLQGQMVELDDGTTLEVRFHKASFGGIEK